MEHPYIAETGLSISRSAGIDDSFSKLLMFFIKKNAKYWLESAPDMLGLVSLGFGLLVGQFEDITFGSGKQHMPHNRFFFFTFYQLT